MENIFYEKRILLGVSGSIAAYKSPLLLRELIKNGADVKVIMTPSSENFVSKMVLSNLSRNDVICDMFDKTMQTSGAWHIKLAHECDLMIIAPCSASTLGKLANAVCDNALVTIAIALEPSVPLLISPAMDSTMWLHPATQRVVRTVQNDGAIIIPPVEGDLSSGLTGPGRFPEINDIMKQISIALNKNEKHKRYIQEVISTQTTKADEKKKSELEYLIDSPIESISKAIEKDKYNAELEFEKLKQKLT